MTRRRALTIIILLILIGLLSALAGALFGLVKLPEFITSQPLVALLLVGVALGGLGYWLYLAQSQSPAEKLPPDSRHRTWMLKHVRTLTKQLAQSLQGATKLELGLAEQQKVVISFSLLLLQHHDQPTLPLPSQTDILQAYNEAEGQLLILGEPGAGKTTLLLELAERLLDHAELDESVPIPVIFNLASWAAKQQPLDDWMVEELANPSYDVPRKLGKIWIETEKIQPLLDGLDEVAKDQISSCVDVINDYRDEHRVAPPVVCCRKADYPDHPHLRLRPYLINPLSEPQIEALLSSAGEPLAGLRQALDADETLHALTPLPLMLNLMILAYHGMPKEAILTPSSLSDQQQRVLADFVKRRLERRGGDTNKLKQTPLWLGWLAEQMTEHQQKEFYLEELQPDWLPSERKIYGMPFRLAYRFLSGMLAWIFTLFAYLVAMALLFPLALGILSHPLSFFTFQVGALPINLLFGAVFGLFTGVGGALFTQIKPAEVVSLSKLGEKLWQSLRVSWKLTWWIVLIYFIITFLSYTDYLGQEKINHPFSLFFPLTMADFFVTIALVVGFIRGVSTTQLVNQGRRLRPNQGIWLSVKNGLRLGALAGCFIGIIATLLFWLVYAAVPPISGLSLNLFFEYVIWLGTLAGIPVGLAKGGYAGLKHLALRILLWQAGKMPWRYVRFLDDATECILLRKVGGGYIFVHRLLQDYFAPLDARPAAPAGT